MCLSGSGHPKTLISLHLVDSVMLLIRVPAQIIGASVFPDTILSLPTFLKNSFFLQELVRLFLVWDSSFNCQGK